MIGAALTLLKRLRASTPGAKARRKQKAKAADLIAAYGSDAYHVAREQARMERAAGRFDHEGFWAGVKREIARTEGKVIGLRASDRWT